MDVVNFLIVLLGYMPLVAFFGALFGGEEITFLLSIFAITNSYPLWMIYIFCFLGIIVADLFWFTIGKTKFASKFRRYGYFKIALKKVEKFVDKQFHENNFLLLASAKFLYGLRMVALIFFAGRMKYGEFFRNIFIVDALWVGLIVLLGWGAGQGVELIWDTFKNIQMIITVGIIIIIGIYLLRIILSRVIKKWLED